MDSVTRHVIGHAIMFVVRLILGGTVVYAIRRWQKVEPPWSWLKATGAFLLLGLIASVFALIPFVGALATLVVFLIGFKRFTGLELINAFFVAFAMGILVFAIAVVVAKQLDIGWL